MDLSLALLFFCFLVLAASTWRQWTDPEKRNRESWWIDGAGLLIQGLGVPLLRVGVSAVILRSLWPAAAGQVEIPGATAFLLSFTLIDYLYYWNHRGLHNAGLWPLHRVHHTTESLDLWASSRNSVWTPLLLVYLWSQTAIVFLLKDPSWFLWGVAASNALDLWRHSSVRTPAFVRKTLGAFLILPEDHEWHHSRDRHGVNFGANLNLWDRWHGSFHRPPGRAEALGVITKGSLSDRLWRPWRLR